MPTSKSIRSDSPRVNRAPPAARPRSAATTTMTSLPNASRCKSCGRGEKGLAGNTQQRARVPIAVSRQIPASGHDDRARGLQRLNRLMQLLTRRGRQQCMRLAAVKRSSNFAQKGLRRITRDQKRQIRPRAKLPRSSGAAVGKLLRPLLRVLLQAFRQKNHRIQARHLEINRLPGRIGGVLQLQARRLCCP